MKQLLAITVEICAVPVLVIGRVKDQLYEFLFIASPLRMRGATASPIRPLAIPIRHNP
ncbi:MAG: hypothetical protein QNJ94_21025 [Alphaproteobacteria bacterium]|nr:hypothetical protein [Alphaproteobacteria bacterium]